MRAKSRRQDSQMNDSPFSKRTTTFVGLIVLFFLTLLFFTLGRSYFRIAAALAIAFGLLGLVLTAQTFRTHEPRLHRLFFLTTGIAAAMIPTSALLHNLVYALASCFSGTIFGQTALTSRFSFCWQSLLVPPCS